MLTGDNGILTRAVQAKFVSEVSYIKEQVEIKKLGENTEYSGTINDFLEITSDYNNKLILQEGELVYVASNISSQEAKWCEELGIQASSDYFTVDFDTAGGTEIASQSIKIGKTAKKPKDPTKEGHVFLGWYYLQEGGTEEEPTYEEKEFDFNTKIISNYNLYAKYSGEAVMMVANWNEAFWQETYRTKIASIVFTKDSLLIPNAPLDSWDVEADENCANIKAYLAKDETDNSLYKLIIYSEYTIYANQNATNLFSDFSKLKTINFENFDTSKCYQMLYMFKNDLALTDLNIRALNTSKVTTMYGMFSNCSNITSLNLTGLDTSNVKTMQSMFSNCSSITSIDLNGLDTRNVTTMRAMFRGNTNLTNINMKNCNTQSLINMYDMFRECKSIVELDLNSFDTSKVTTMYSMFYECNKLSRLNISNFDTGNVKDMQCMFAGCKTLVNLDLSNFKTNLVYDMSAMFFECRNLTTVYVGEKWTTEAVENSKNMFMSNSKLVGEKQTKYNSSHIDKEYAHVDGGPSNPGYFTFKK